MTASPLHDIRDLLAAIGSQGSFSARCTATPRDLRLEVTGVGPIRLPFSKARARELLRVARPARHGRGERTLLDPRVRDTWEIPKSRVKIDRRGWNRTLLPMLDRLRGDLGLPEGRRLKAELHNALIYAPGQFFLPHQDSEKADEMIGTLVVTLPSRFKGGAFVSGHTAERRSPTGHRRSR